MYSIDAIVGPYRAAELVNAYKQRLQSQDCLPDKAALAVACTAYAFHDIYVLASPGQMWESAVATGTGEKERVSIVDKFYDHTAGHCVRTLTSCGIYETVSLDTLAEMYYLYSWAEE
ncbi:hypothetical protein [Streptomyces sp. WAC06614]|uniref:hypothetical protein n=1 Tax=Streptomyces sp. WAC06614 TaxID=2487416 RepID=UPI000F7AB89A|nr:hypothetical protein [Streptomyces sp. WAC06614]RSS81855.1 hypothetical protein EF918_08990 [Streptomyces sp. WAC06614]